MNGLSRSPDPGGGGMSQGGKVTQHIQISTDSSPVTESENLLA